jgi:hypothetical protein
MEAVAINAHLDADDDVVIGHPVALDGLLVRPPAVRHGGDAGPRASLAVREKIAYGAGDAPWTTPHDRHLGKSRRGEVVGCDLRGEVAVPLVRRA